MMTVFSKFRALVALLLTALVFTGLALMASAAETVDEKLYQTLKYRSIGPFRGGRVTAVAGIEKDPLTYYFGATGGG